MPLDFGKPLGDVKYRSLSRRVVMKRSYRQKKRQYPRGYGTRFGFTSKSKRLFVPGYSRTGGSYGRYSGANPEMKFFDGTDGATTLSAGAITNATLLTIPEGNGESERIGRKLTVKKLFFKGVLLLPSTSQKVSTSDQVRMIVYLDKQCNGATATVANILEEADVNSFRNLEETDRFHILADRQWSLSCQSGSWDGTDDQFGEVVRHFSMNFNLNREIIYDSTASTGVIATIRSNNLGVLVISGSGLATMTYKWRVRYSDI